jgi:hypothetical protein
MEEQSDSFYLFVARETCLFFPTARRASALVHNSLKGKVSIMKNLLDAINGRGNRRTAELQIGDLLGLMSGDPRAIGMDFEGEPEGKPVVVYQTPKTRQRVRDGICMEEKTVQLRLEVLNGILFCIISVFESDESEKPQAEWPCSFSKVKVVRVLRAIEIFQKCPVVHRNSYAMATASVHEDEQCYDRAKKDVITLIGQGPYDEIVESASEDCDDLMVALFKSDVAFDHDEIRQALRDRLLEECDAIAAVGIEVPVVYDDRKKREAEATKKFRNSFSKWLKHMGYESSATEVDRLCAHAVQVISRGTTQDVLVVAGAAALYILEEHCDGDLSDLTQSAVAEHIGCIGQSLSQSADFCARRYKSGGQEAYQIEQYSQDLLLWFDATEPETQVAGNVAEPAPAMV